MELSAVHTNPDMLQCIIFLKKKRHESVAEHETREFCSPNRIFK